jgi:hypothetical protein
MAFFDRVRDRAQPRRAGHLELTVFGDTQLSRGFVRGAGRLRDLRPAFHHIHDWLLEVNLRRFRAEGPGWPALEAMTERERIRMGIGGPHPILDRTGAGTYGTGVYKHEGGDLKRSMTEKGDENQKVKITRSAFSFESLVRHGAILQGGDRKPFQLSNADRKIPMRILHRHAMDLPQ